VQDPLQLELLDSIGTPEQLGVAGGLSNLIPCEIPVVFLNSTDPPGLIEAVDGLHDVLLTASMEASAARPLTTPTDSSATPSTAVARRWIRRRPFRDLLTPE
jgi:hypothetical protein